MLSSIYGKKKLLRRGHLVTGEKVDSRGLIEGILRYGKDRSSDAFVREIGPYLPSLTVTVQAACGVAAMWAHTAAEHHMLHHGHKLTGARLYIGADDDEIPREALPVVNGLRMFTAYSNGDNDTPKALAAAAANAGTEDISDLLAFLVDQFVEAFFDFKSCQAAAARS
jgi:hypothetical protein